MTLHNFVNLLDHTISLHAFEKNMAIVLFDNTERNKLFPLTRTQAIGDLFMGLFSQRLRWEMLTGMDILISTAQYLQPLYPEIPEGVHTWVDASVVADSFLVELVLSLEEGGILRDEKKLVAGKFSSRDAAAMIQGTPQFTAKAFSLSTVRRLTYCWEMFQWNDWMIREDFKLLCRSKTSRSLPSTAKVICPENVFIGEGSSLEFATINAATGPVYIGSNATVMEGALIRGPFAMCENATVKMGAKIYGATTLGPGTTAGGEIKNSLLQAFSSKAHEGYLGDSVIGRWCNLGAGTSNSNLKNTGTPVKMFEEASGELVSVGIKCGMILGDYSRLAINTSVNTGSQIGACCNVFGAGLLPKLIPDFSWGGATVVTYEFDQAIRDIQNWKSFRQQELTAAETAVLKYIFDNQSTQTL